MLSSEPGLSFPDWNNNIFYIYEDMILRFFLSTLKQIFFPQVSEAINSND